MADCNDESLLDNILYDCIAGKRPGGIKPAVYATRVGNIEGMVIDPTTKALSSLTLKAGAKFIKLEGKKFKNTGGASFQKAENGPDLRSHSFSFRAYVATQVQRDSADALLDQEDMVIFAPLNAGVVKVYGYAKAPFDSQGMAVTAAEESDGTAMADDTSLLINFTGAEPNLPMLYAETGGFPATLDYLEGLVTGAA